MGEETLMKKLQTKNLTLSPATNEDFQILSQLWRDKEVRKFLGGTLSDDAIEEKIIFLHAHFKKYHYGIFTVVENTSKEIIGLCGLLNTEHGVELVYMYFPIWWRKGLAHEAAQATLEFGFNKLKLEHIVAITQAANEKSCNMLERLGMHVYGTMEKFGDIQQLYEISKTDWER